MSILSDLRLDVGDESVQTGTVTSQVTPITELRVDIGDESSSTGASLSGISSTIDDIRVDVGDEGIYVGTISSGCAIIDAIRVDLADDVDSFIFSPPVYSNGGTSTHPGCVIGPQTSTDQGIARFDGTTGDVIEGSLATLDDFGNIVTPGGLTIDGNLSLGAAQFWNRRVVTDPGNVNINGSDNIILLNKTVGEPTNVYLPSPSNTRSMIIIIKDMRGDASINNITIIPSAGTIDGQSAFLLSQDYQSYTLIHNGVEWNIV